MAGKAFKKNTNIAKIFKNETDIKYVYKKSTLVFASSHMVDYFADTGDMIELEIDDGYDAIENAPEVSKEGWTFVGWRQDTQPTAQVLDHLVVDTDGIMLYAVFTKTITVSLLGGEEIVQVSGPQYYNNSSIGDPSINLTPTTLTGWTLRGYREDTTATSDVPYLPNHSYPFGENTSLNSVFYRTISLYTTYLGSQHSSSGIQYKNSSNYNNPTLYQDDPSLSGTDFKGWSSSSSSTSVVNVTLQNGIEISDDTYRYAVWRYHDAVLYDTPQSGTDHSSSYGEDWTYENPHYTYLPFYINGTTYSQAILNITANPHVGTWNISNQCGTYLEGDGTLRYKDTWNGNYDFDGADIKGYPCYHNAYTDATVNVPNQSNYQFKLCSYGSIEDWGGDGGIGWGVKKVTGLGRTVVY